MSGSANNRYFPCFGAMLGGLYFLFVYGSKILNPEFIAWTMKGDAAQHYLGWHFFRSESWGFPLGEIRSFLYPEGTSIVYTDSIPLLAILFKLISPVLSDTFQYHGIWLLLIYVLQGYCSVLLLSQASNHFWIMMLGSLFFIMNPVLVQRAGGHEALAAHWLILVALYLYFQKAGLRYQLMWLGTILIASLIHFYLLFMVLMIWSGYLLKIYLFCKHRENFKEALIFVVGTLLALIAVMWLAGYFVIQLENSTSAGFGSLSMNILAPMNPTPSSYFTFLDSISLVTKNQVFEGSNYFGVGLLILVLFSMYEFLCNRRSFVFRQYVPLLMVCLLLTLLALSNKITFSKYVLVNIPLPNSLDPVFGVLRSSGRLFWPVTYVIIFSCVLIINRTRSANQAIFLLLALLSIQAIDFIPLYQKFVPGNKKWHSPLISNRWDQLAAQNRHLVIIPSRWKGDDYVPFSLLAANHRMTINIGYTARVDAAARNVYRQQLARDFYNEKYEPNTLYVIRNKRLWHTVKAVKSVKTEMLDGYLIATKKKPTF